MKSFARVSQAITFSGYRNIKLLGQGASAKVYLAQQESTGQHVAIKHLQCHPTGSENKQLFMQNRRLRFLRETDICAQLNNPHIVRLIDQGFCTDQSPYAVFEYVPGETLAQYLAQQGALDGEQTKHLMLQVLDALACAHQHGIIHRDLKPQNLMVSKTGTETCIKILDFGISAWQDANQREHQKLTLTQETLGTPHYSAPEQLRNKTLGAYSDLYTWGLIMIECLIGKPIINAATVADSIRQQLDPAPLVLPPFIAQHPIAHLLRRVLTKNPHQRLHYARHAYDELMGIAMHTLLAKTPSLPHYSNNEYTQTNLKSHHLALSEKRFITVLACRITLQAYNNTPINEERIDQEFAHKIQACYELLSHYGGRPNGHIGNILLTFFGDEQPLDNCAETAAKTAILIRQQAAKWNRELQKAGISLAVEQVIHCGNALSNTAFNSANHVSKLTLTLLQTAKINEILVSSAIYTKLANTMHFSGGRQDTNQPNDIYHLLSEHKQAVNHCRQIHQIEGRDKELLQLEKIFLKREEYNQAVTICGEAGMGKSALISQALGMFIPNTLNVIHWSGHISNQQSALHSILNEIRERLTLEGTNQSLPLRMSMLKKTLQDHDTYSKHHFVVMAHWLNISSQAILAESHLYSPEKQQELLFETLCKLTFNCNQTQPCIVVIEDIHWLDAISLQFIQYMTQQATEQRLLLLMTYRTQSISDESIDLHLENIDTHIFHLQPLNEDATKALIDKHLRTEKNNPQHIHKIVQRSSGIPLFIKELTQLANNGIDANESIPLSLNDILASRIQQAGAAKPLLHCLGVFSQSISEEELVRLMQTDKKNIQPLLQQLLSIGLIQQICTSDSELVRYSFQHALYQETVYQQINTQDKKQYHLMIAQYLANTKEPLQSANIAHHYAAANAYSKAVEQGLIAVQYLLSIASSGQALEEIQHILRWCKLLDPAASHRAQLRALQFKLHGMTNQLGWAHPEVSESVKQLQDIIPQYIAPFAQQIDSVCYWTLATYYHVASQRIDAQKIAQHLVDTSHHVVDKTLMLLGYGLKGVTHWIDGHYSQAATALKLTVIETDDTVDKHIATQYGLDVKVWAGAALANVYWFQGETARALEQARQTIKRATIINHLPSLGIALMYQAFIFQHEQDHDKTKDCASELLSLADTYGLPAVQGYATALLGWSNHDAVIIEKTLQQLQSLGCLLGSSYLYSLLAEAAQQQGDKNAAIAWVNEGLQAAKAINEPYFLVPLYQQKALYLKQLSTDTHRSAIEQCLQHSQQLCHTQKIRRDCYLPLKQDSTLDTGTFFLTPWPDTFAFL